MNYGLGEMLLHGWPVISILLLCSILSLSIIIDRMVVMRAARIDTRGFVGAVKQVIREEGVAAAAAFCANYRQPLARVAHIVLTANGGRAERERVMRMAIQEQIHQMEVRVPALGTIGSVSPFIGLFGTVVGIIKAFHAIAKNAGGGPEVVSVGISEALVTTAFGLLVAIPAIVAYNYFANRIRRTAEEMDLAVQVIIDDVLDQERSGR